MTRNVTRGRPLYTVIQPPLKANSITPVYLHRMAKGFLYEAELKELENYLRSDANEDAKRQMLFPLFRKIYRDKMQTESAAKGADVYIEGMLV